MTSPRTPIGRRRALGWFAGAPLAVLAGCSTLPTSGPVERVGEQPSARGTEGVEIAPQPPPPGASPEVILAGFLAAMSSVQDVDFAAARQYLTPEAQKRWSPGVGTTVYDSEANKPIATASSASLNAPVVGRLDRMGRHLASDGTLVHDFGMTRVHDQWRISAPPQGLLIARYVFRRYYTAFNLYFLTADGERFAIERVHRPADLMNPTEAVRALLARPSEWLSAAATSAVPADTRLSVNAVTVTDGVAEVSLTDQIARLAERQRVQLAAQLTYTLLQFSQISSIRVLSNGQPWQVPGAAPDGTVDAGLFDAFVLLDGQEDAPMLVVRGNRVGTVTSTRATFAPLAGALGRGTWGDAPGRLAAHRSGDVIAVCNRAATALFVAGPDGDLVVRRHVGQQLARPQVLDDRSVWVVDHAGGAPRLVVVSPSGEVSHSAMVGLGRRRVLAFRVSPDRTRMALVLQAGKGAELGLMRVRGGGTVVVDGWRRLPLTSVSGQLRATRDVVWSGPDTLLVLAAADAQSTFSTLLVSADGADVESLGPSGIGATPVLVTSLPRRSGTTAAFVADTSQGFTFEGAYRWIALPDRVSDVCLPG